MREMMKWLAVGALVVLLSACGGGGTPQNDGNDSNGTTADTTPPTFTSPTTVTVAENQTNALTLQATDTSTPIVYSISDTDSSSFTVDSSTGVVTFNTAPDYETKTSYTFTAKATDAQGNSAMQSVTVTISDVDDTPPTFTSDATVTVAENQTNALTLQATDTSTPIVYSISGGDSDSFNIDSATGKVTLKTAPDYETKNSYTFTAKATDAVGNVATQSVTVNIGNINEAPVLLEQNLSVSFKEHNVSNLPHAIKEVAIDMDGDGDIDIVAGSYENSDRIVWYENQGDTSFVEHNITEVPSDQFDIDIVDIDSDGDLDILSATFDDNGRLRLYVNDGNQNFSEQNISNIPSNGVKATDIDSDGDIDMVVATNKYFGENNASALSWYEQDNGAFIEHNITTDANASYFHIELADIDKDGDLDIVSSSAGMSRAMWYENRDGGFEEHIAYDFNRSYLSYAPSVTDIDKDGDFDILFISSDSNGDNKTLVWLENSGSQTFTEHNITASSKNLIREGIDIYSVDIDQDGDIDIFAGNKWYENSGNMQFTEHTITNNFTTFSTFEDIDGDGDIDIALPYLVAGLVTWQENRGGKNSFYIKENNTTVGSIGVIDEDGDSLTYSLAGDDANLFDINATTGMIAFKSAPDYENPADSDSDNVYDITVTVSDGNLTDTKDIYVVVEDIDDEG